MTTALEISYNFVVNRKTQRKKVIVVTIEELYNEMKRGFEDVNRRLGNLETDVAWIKGKLEGTQESKASGWQIITTATAVGAVIIALIALLE